VHPQVGNPTEGTSIHQIVEDLLGERIEALAGWIQELDAQVRTTAAAGDEKTLKELRKALEAWTKRDPKFEERLTERVDVLADRLATLSSTLNTTAAARASSEGEIAGLRRELEQETTRLHAALRELGTTAVSKELQELRRSVADLGRGATRDSGSAGGSREEFENLAVRVDMLGKTVATTAAGLAGREGDLASLRRSLEGTGAKVEQIVASLPRSSDASDIARLDAKLADLGEKILDATAAMGERERGAATLRKQIEDQGTKLEAFATAVRDSMRALEARVADVAGKDDGAAAVAELTARVASLGERVDGGDPRVDDLRATLDAVSSQLGDLSNARAGSSDEIAALRRHVDESGRRFDAAVADLRALVDALPTEPPLAAIDTRLAPVQAQVDGLVAKVDESGARFDGALAEMRRLVDALPTEPPLAEIETRLGPLQAQVAELAARLVEADARVTERLERETAQTSRLDERLADVDTHLEEVRRRLDASGTQVEVARSAWELERAWVREQMDALVSAMADTASRADVEPLAADLGRRLEELASEQAALGAEIARTRDTVLADAERLDARLRELPDASPSQADLEPLVADLGRRLEEVVGRQSGDEAKVASEHETLRAGLERLEARLEALPEASAPIPPSEDAQLKRLLTAFADRIDAMESQRATIADEASVAAQAHVDSVRPLVEGLRRRLDESDRRLEALGPTEGLTEKLEEVAVRLEALEARPTASPQPTPLPGDGRFRVELRALDLRMQHAEAAARENREAVLVQLERLASRIEWRLQRLESGERPEPEPAQEEPPLGQVVPLRGSAET
jgi:chromosome segregation ATPase